MSDLRVVIGPPCSGKSTYVDTHAKSGDVRIDFDRIAVALGSETPHEPPDGIKSATYSARQGAIDRVIDDGIPAWVIHSNPSDEQMARYEDAGAEFIWMDADLETCLQRAEDDGRPSVTFAVIREWFDQHPDPDQQRAAPQGAFFLAREAEMPFKPSERQYRSFAASNFSAIENTDNNEPSYRVKGYFTTFNDEYVLYERTKYWPAEYEQIDPNAFDGCDMSDVVFQFDHQGMVMARQRNNTLTVGTDHHGAWCEAYLGGCEQGRNLFEAIQNGLIDEMSFGFSIASDDDGEGYTYTRDESGDYHTTITRISKVYDCSAVSIPANPSTEIGEMRKRSYLAAQIEADRKHAEEEMRKAQEAEERQRMTESANTRRRKAMALEFEGIQLGF